jgi:hypothetical protein
MQHCDVATKSIAMAKMLNMTAEHRIPVADYR